MTRFFLAPVLLVAEAFSGFAAEPARTSVPFSQLTPVVYNDELMKAFLAEYLELTESQMIRAEAVFAGARANLYVLGSEARASQEKLDGALTSGIDLRIRQASAAHVAVQSRILEAETGALRKFYALLDGEQRHRLSRLAEVAVVPVNGKPMVKYTLAAD